MKLIKKLLDYCKVFSNKKLKCFQDLDYSTYGICKECGTLFGIAELDDGECYHCGNKNIEDGDFT